MRELNTFASFLCAIVHSDSTCRVKYCACILCMCIRTPGVGPRPARIVHSHIFVLHAWIPHHTPGPTYGRTRTLSCYTLTLPRRQGTCEQAYSAYGPSHGTCGPAYGTYEPSHSMCGPAYGAYGPSHSYVWTLAWHVRTFAKRSA